MTTLATSVEPKNDFLEFETMFEDNVNLAGLKGLSESMQLAEVAVDDYFINVTKASFKTEKKNKSRPTYMFDGYGYVFRKNKGRLGDVVARTVFTDFREIKTSPDGVYRWIMYVHNGTIGLICKHMYPSLPFVSSQLDMLHGLFKRLPKNAPIMVLGGGEFLKSTKLSDGLPSYDFRINTHSDSSVELETLMTPLITKQFILFVFTKLGPKEIDGTSLYCVNLADMSYLDREGVVSLNDVKFHVMEYAIMNGYTVYEFKPAQRYAFNRQQPLVFAKFTSRLKVINAQAGCLARLAFMNGWENPMVENTTLPHYIAMEKLKMMSDLKMMSNIELASYKMSLHTWQTVVELRDATINMSCAELGNCENEIELAHVRARITTPVREAIWLSSNPLRRSLEYVYYG